MSKKKKKIVKLTARQKLQKRVSSVFSSVRDGMLHTKRRAADAVSAAHRLYYRLLGPVSGKWSILPLTAMMFGLMMLTYALWGHYYLTRDVFLAFPATVTFYTPDYSVGFISKALAGEIWSWFSDVVSMKPLLKISRTAEFLSLILQSAAAAAVFKKGFLKKSPVICAAAAVFAASPIVLTAFIYNMGMLDMYNVLLLAVLFLLSDTRSAVVLTPVICVLCVMNHYDFMLAMFPAVFMVLFYYVFTEKRLRKARVACLVVTSLACVGLAAYFVFFSNRTVTMNKEELNAFLLSKIPVREQEFFLKDYYSDWIFREHSGVRFTTVPDALMGMLTTSSEFWTFHDLFPSFYTILPFYVFLAYFWIHAARRAKKGRKLPYLLFLLMPLVLPASLVFSTDVTRFTAESYLANLILLGAVLKKDDVFVQEAVDRLQRRIDTPRRRAAALLLVFAFAFVGLSFYTRWIPV